MPNVKGNGADQAGVVAEKSEEFKSAKLEIASEIFRLESKKEKLKRDIKDSVQSLRDTIADVDDRIKALRADFAKDYIEQELF